MNQLNQEMKSLKMENEQLKKTRRAASPEFFNSSEKFESAESNVTDAQASDKMQRR